MICLFQKRKERKTKDSLGLTPLLSLHKNDLLHSQIFEVVFQARRLCDVQTMTIRPKFLQPQPSSEIKKKWKHAAHRSAEMLTFSSLPSVVYLLCSTAHTVGSRTSLQQQCAQGLQKPQVQSWFSFCVALPKPPWKPNRSFLYLNLCPHDSFNHPPTKETLRQRGERNTKHPLLFQPHVLLNHACTRCKFAQVLDASPVLLPSKNHCNQICTDAPPSSSSIPMATPSSLVQDTRRPS